MDTDTQQSYLSDIRIWLIIGTVIAILFGGYEILERTYVDPYFPEWKYYLHILRGVLTTLIASGLVGIYLASHPPFMDYETKEPSKLPETINRKQDRSPPFHQQLVSRMNRWFVRMRWVVCGIALLFLLLDKVNFGVLTRYQFVVLVGLFTGLGLVNLLLKVLCKSKDRGRLVSIVQLGLDLTALTVLVHLTGGVESPFFLLYSFPVIISGMLYSPKFCYGTVLAASLLFVTVLVMEGIELVGHYPLWEAARITIGNRQAPVYHEPGILIAAMGFLTGFLLIVAYMITSARNRIRMERRQLRDQMIHTGKMNVLRTLSGGIAHEMGNAINCLNTRLQLMERENSLNAEELEDHVDVLQKHTNQLNHHVQMFSRIAQRDTLPLRSNQGSNINQAIRNTVDLLSYQTRKHEIDVQTNLAQNLPRVSISSKALEQILLNLGRNGIEAMTEGGTLTFTSCAEHDDIFVQISDTGQGISDEIRERMFEPFSSTKQAGFGLGLFLVRQILDACNGEIVYESTPDEGTICTIRFPSIHSKTQQ